MSPNKRFYEQIPVNSVAASCCIMVNTKGHRILAKIWPCDMSHDVQRVELHATCCRDKIAAIFILNELKILSTHHGTCRYNMSLLHVPATCASCAGPFMVCDNFSIYYMPPLMPKVLPQLNPSQPHHNMNVPSITLVSEPALPLLTDSS